VSEGAGRACRECDGLVPARMPVGNPRQPSERSGSVARPVTVDCSAVGLCRQRPHLGAAPVAGVEDAHPALGGVVDVCVMFSVRGGRVAEYLLERVAPHGNVEPKHADTAPSRNANAPTQLLAYFHTGRASNGSTEAVNLLIKRIKRVGFGFRNFDNYRLRLLLHCGTTWNTHRTTRIRGRSPRWFRRAQYLHSQWIQATSEWDTRLSDST